MRTYHFLVATGLAAAAGCAFGQPDAPAAPEAPVSDASEIAPSHITVSTDVVVTNQYFWRGILQEDEGVIVQPGASVSVDLEPGTGVPITAFGGVWGSFHDRGTGATGTDEFVSRWYEFDATAGLETSHERWTGSVAYTTYSSPNGAFGSVDEVSASVSFDDDGLLAVPLAPAATLAFEIGENEADGGTGQGIFFGLGVAPSFQLLEESAHPVTLTVPAEVGLSLKDYYEDGTGDDDVFGYARVGAEVSVDVPTPVGYGGWSLRAGVGLTVLGDNTSQINGGDDVEVQFLVGVSTSW